MLNMVLLSMTLWASVALASSMSFNVTVNINAWPGTGFDGPTSQVSGYAYLENQIGGDTKDGWSFPALYSQGPWLQQMTAENQVYQGSGSSFHGYLVGYGPDYFSNFAGFIYQAASTKAYASVPYDIYAYQPEEPYPSLAIPISVDWTYQAQLSQADENPFWYADWRAQVLNGPAIFVQELYPIYNDFSVGPMSGNASYDAYIPINWVQEGPEVWHASGVDSVWVGLEMVQEGYTYAPVPLPGALWLFASGLIGLLGCGRKALKG